MKIKLACFPWALFLHMLISGYVERGLQLTYLVHGNIQSFDSMMYNQTHPPSHVARCLPAALVADR